MSTLVALRQRKKDIAKNACDKTEAKIVILFFPLVISWITVESLMVDLENKILIFEPRKGATTTKNKKRE